VCYKNPYKFQFIERRNYNTFGRFYPRLYTVWLLFRKKEGTPKGTCDRAGSLQTLLIGLDARMDCSKIKI
jgi:hypothetical protein